MTTAPPLPGAAAASNSLSFQGLNQLKAAVVADPRSPQAIKAVAQQFEALLMQQMLGAMDATRLGPDLLGDTSGPMFKSMFNQQLAVTLSQGQGMGLASFIARDLSTRYGLDPAAPKAQPADPSSLAAQAVNTGASALPLASGAAALPATSLAAYRQNALPLQSAPAPTAAQPSPGGPSLEQAKTFIARILPSVQAAAKQLGVTPVAILAQAALETGWGRHTPGNNLFGIKAGGGWAGGAVQTLTREFQNGVASVGAAAFRAYQNVADSVDNYAALLSRPRYQSARGQGNDISAFATALQRSGYATDPDYAAKLVAIARSPRMQQALQQLGVEASSDSSSAVQ
ncbi:MAG: flagellar assembly peptidoglycan hydrolase FlgJ [Thiomonas sp.]|uniref:flagellar assembly peptidoglycan hydrolase FlgJ n=1 Tax=Thiomonas sp. TaxID=2047785 RepID=UPI002A36E7CB|nr:flagellar assembly peptidoglycan hydrolase FlgJ [Thiomonas sp.]MDY0331386.1 flagellar assembly peptidoglycan hydrolase FlgJ [Thiomonas sp.]